MTPPSFLNREIASSSPLNDSFVIWVSHCLHLTAGVPIGTLTLSLTYARNRL